MNRRMNIKRIRLIQRIILFLLVIIALLYICSLLYYSKEGFECNTRTDISKGVTTYLCDTQAEAEDKLTNGIPTNIISYDMCYNVNIDSNVPNKYVCYNRPGPNVYDDVTSSYRPYDNIGDNDISPALEKQTNDAYCNSLLNSFKSFEYAYNNTRKFQSSVHDVNLSSIQSIVYHLSNTSTTYCPKVGANSNVCNTLKGGITTFTTIRDDTSPNTISAISTNVGQSVSTMKQYIYRDLIPMYIDSGCTNVEELNTLKTRQIF